MSINKEIKTRIIVTVTKELKAKLEERAKKENRTVANLLNTIAMRYLESEESTK